MLKPYVGDEIFFLVDVICSFRDPSLLPPNVASRLSKHANDCFLVSFTILIFIRVRVSLLVFFIYFWYSATNSFALNNCQIRNNFLEFLAAINKSDRV